MLYKRPAEERGPTNMGWLNSMHTFSFGHYYDPQFMGFGPLRVINDDRVRAGAGFDTHPHRNMEIISYVLEGSLAHKDSMGNGSVIKAGEVQLMSAGSGVTHSEYNGSKKKKVRFLQIWIMPNQLRTSPEYFQKAFPDAELANQFRVVVAPDEKNGALKIKQDAKLLLGKFEANRNTTQMLDQNRQYWVQMATGKASINGIALKEGDGLAIVEEQLLELNSQKPSQILLFDLPKNAR